MIIFTRAEGLTLFNSNPYVPKVQTVKRIIGLPGDLVHTRPPFHDPYIRVPPGHIWVEGDEGGKKTLDSNTYGPISIQLVTGQLTHVLWPLRKFGRIRWWEHPDRLVGLRD